MDAESDLGHASMSNLKRLRRERAVKQQVQQQFALMLEVQTLSLMLTDLRSRISEIEKYLDRDKRAVPELPSLGNMTRWY
jgi:hypothetical protein